MKITSLKAEKILAANNKHTLKLTLNKKYSVSVPQGSSVGSHEVAPYPKKGLSATIHFLNTADLSHYTIEEFPDLALFESLTEDIGGNGVLALQYASLKALADKKPLWKYLNPKARNIPIPLGNVIGGGAHSKTPGTDFQEYLLIPRGKTITENVLANELLWRSVKQQHPKARLTYEGAFHVKHSSDVILDKLKDLISMQEAALGIKIDLGLDIAATNFYKKNSYHYNYYSRKEQKKTLTKEGQIGYVNHLISEYGLVYVEDALEEHDPEGFGRITAKLNCGDDLICTNIDLLKKYKKHITSVIVKPNQIGSITKTKEFVDYCHKNNITPVISHRSGDTTDDMIAHLAVAWNIPYIKTGIHGKERRTKLNTLLQIEKGL